MYKFKRKILILISILTFIFSVNVYANDDIQTEIIPNNIIRNDLDNGAKEIIKVYELDRSQELKIDINNFIEGELEYKYIATDSKEIIETDEKEVSHIVQIETMNKDRSYLFSQYDLTIEHTTDDGYTGTLELDTETLKTEIKGYVTKYYQVYESRTYSNLPTNDVAYIPKTINVGGYNYTMSNINWVYNSNFAENSIIPETYSANVTYERTASSQNATGYITTVEYKGIGIKNTKDVIKYEVRFRTDENIESVIEEDTVTKSETETSSNISALGIVFIVLIFLLVIGALIFVYIKFFHTSIVDSLHKMKMKKQIKANMLKDIEIEEENEHNDNDD